MSNDIRDIDARALRVGLTLSSLAKMAGVSPGTISKLNKGEPVRDRPFNKLVVTLEKLEHQA